MGKDSWVRTLVELADTLVDDYDPVEFLYGLTEKCVDVLDAAAVGVLLVHPEGRLDVVAASNQEMHVLELFEAQSRQGPCFEAFTSKRRLVEPDLLAQRERWPEFTERAAALDYRSVHAEPLLLRSDCIGALNIFRGSTGLLSEEEALVAAGMADMATIGILHERAVSARDDQILQLRTALERRAAVEQAKGALSERLGVDGDQAFDWLRRYARDNNKRLHDVARRFLDGDLGHEVFTPR